MNYDANRTEMNCQKSFASAHSFPVHFSAAGSRRSLDAGAFSLVELLTVVSFIAVLTAVTVPAIQTVFQSRQLTANGNLIADLAGSARQNSMSKRGLTALVMVTDYPLNRELNSRLFALFEFDSSPGSPAWRQITAWQILSQGGVVEPSGSQTFIGQNPTLSHPPGSLSYQGQPVEYCYQVFAPDGSLAASALPGLPPPKIRLVEGVIDKDGNRLFKKGAGPEAANYYDIFLNPFTGMAKIERP